MDSAGNALIGSLSSHSPALPSVSPSTCCVVKIVVVVVVVVVVVFVVVIVDVDVDVVVGQSTSK